jgi:hypothetical protein
VDPAHEAEYNAWHADEHVPERLTVPGMLWASRWRRASPGAGPRYLTLYGLRDAAVLEEPAYQRLLAQPTPASQRMRPLLQNLSRWVCAIESQWQWPSPLNDSEWMALRTRDGDHKPDRGPLANPAAASAAVATARLAARRLPQARNLPWVETSQTETIAGDRLEAWTMAQASGDSQPPTAVLYWRLPVNAF